MCLLRVACWAFFAKKANVSLAENLRRLSVCLSVNDWAVCPIFMKVHTGVLCKNCQKIFNFSPANRHTNGGTDSYSYSRALHWDTVAVGCTRGEGRVLGQTLEWQWQLLEGHIRCCPNAISFHWIVREFGRGHSWKCTERLWVLWQSALWRCRRQAIHCHRCVAHISLRFWRSSV